MATKDPQNPQAALAANDLGVELVQHVIDWYRGHRNQLTATQQSTAITAITNVLNGTLHV